MNIVLDTNVLVAGLLSPFGTCGEIVRMVSAGELTLLYDARIISEYREVLKRDKFKFNKDKIAALLEYIEFRGQPVASSPLADLLPDADDASFLEVAIAGRVECIITGNQKHFPAKLCQRVKILLPSEFFILYKKERNKLNKFDK